MANVTSAAGASVTVALAMGVATNAGESPTTR